ncbi:hypothetical protein [Emticicia oligotrophica]|nr:hypothetical protein [Emticicia oligotrophica]
MKKIGLIEEKRSNDQHCDGLGLILELINKVSVLYTMLSSWTKLTLRPL